MSVVNGSTQMALRWSYTLPAGIDPRTTRFRKEASNVIGAIFHGSGGDSYQTPDARFNISRSQMATLIINRVTEREEAVYQCELETMTGDTWRYNIRVIVTGEIVMYKL